MQTSFRTIVILLLSMMITGIRAQSGPISISFTAIDDKTYARIGIIKVMNLTNGADTVLLWPDTVLVLNQPSGIAINPQSEEGFKVWQNYPNPAGSLTSIAVSVPGKDIVTMTITDVSGRELINSRSDLDRGLHTFLFSPGCGNLFFFSATWRGVRQSIKILFSTPGAGLSCSLTYAGQEKLPPELKTTMVDRGFPFTVGDELLMIGYIGSFQSGQVDYPTTDHLYIFQFATNTSCPETPTVTYEGQIYNTVQIFSQCWLKENLNVGEMIPGLQNQSDNGIIEKYCYKDKSDSCAKYGALYQWNEMMQYSSQERARGICPPGWHVPSDIEWKILEGAVDSQFGIGNPEWEKEAAIRGYDAGVKLKSSFGWINDHNGTDSFGFSVLPAGHHDVVSPFVGVRISTSLWSSTWVSNYSDIDSWIHNLRSTEPGVGHGKSSHEFGLSVRCLKDAE